MKRPLLFILLLLIQTAFAQTKLPIIKATSKKVAIRDGDYYDKDAWTLSPKARPDIFTADRTRKKKWVTFYTDIDSIRVKVKPGTKFNFIILYNDKDSCYTQIASAISQGSMQQTGNAKNDTIPFTLNAYNAIAIKAIINGRDTINMHFDASSNGFHFIKDSLLKKTLLSISLENGQPVKLNKIDKLQIGPLIFSKPDMSYSAFTARGMDGRIGWDVFDGKQLEIDYDNSLLIVHSKLPENLKGYKRLKMDFIRSYPIIKGTFTIAGKKYTGNFMMDNGSSEAIILDSAWIAEQGFPKDLKLIKSSILTDPRGNKYEIRKVMSPGFTLGNFTLNNVPTLLLTGKSPSGFSINYLGNDLLKRFNMILDFRNDYIYLKPNKLMNVKYREDS